MHDEPELIESLKMEGAHGYLLKNASPEEVRGAILAAANTNESRQVMSPLLS